MFYIAILIYCIIWALCIYNTIVIGRALYSTRKLFDIDIDKPIKVSVPLYDIVHRDDLRYDEDNKCHMYKLGTTYGQDVLLKLDLFETPTGNYNSTCHPNQNVYSTIIDEIYQQVGQTNDNLVYIRSSFDVLIVKDLDEIECLMDFDGIIMIPYDADNPDFYVAYNGEAIKYDLRNYSYKIYDTIMYGKVPLRYIKAKSQRSYYIKNLLLPIPRRYKYLRRFY